MLLHMRICCYGVWVLLGVQNHSGHSHTSGEPAQSSFQAALGILSGLYSAL